MWAQVIFSPTKACFASGAFIQEEPGKFCKDSGKGKPRWTTPKLGTQLTGAILLTFITLPGDCKVGPRFKFRSFTRTPLEGNWAFHFMLMKLHFLICNHKIPCTFFQKRAHSLRVLPYTNFSRFVKTCQQSKKRVVIKMPSHMYFFGYLSMCQSCQTLSLLVFQFLLLSMSVCNTMKTILFSIKWPSLIAKKYICVNEENFCW